MEAKGVGHYGEDFDHSFEEAVVVNAADVTRGDVDPQPKISRFQV